MAAAFPEDEVPETNNNNKIKPRDPADDLVSGFGDDALNADFRFKLGLLDEDDADLTEAFKASIGLLGEEGVGGVEEITWAMDEERDQTISRFKWNKYTKDNFQKGHSDSWIGDPITNSLLPKKHEVDRMASLVVWIAIQRYMGDSKSPASNTPRSKTPIMSKIYRTLEDYARKERKGSLKDDSKKQRRSSWKKVFSRNSSASEKRRDRELARHGSTRSDGSAEITYCDDVTVMMESVPSDELDLVHFIIGHGILRRDLRDEIYCQICKQLRQNPRKQSESRGWMLLALCSGCFLPSEALNKYFRFFLKECTLEYKEYAGYARRTMRRTLTNGMRYHPPNWLEYQATTKKRYVLLPVSFSDHRVESIEADPATTAAEMVTLLANKIGLREEFGFSIFISIYDKVSSLGSGHDHVMDAISECEQVVRSKDSNARLSIPDKKEEDAPWRLYFRKEVFTPWFKADQDTTACHLIYKQICRGIRSGEYACRSEDDLIKFAAQKLYIDNGQNLNPGKVQQELAKTLPSSVIKAGNRTREQWTQAVMMSLQELGYVQKTTPQDSVKVDFVQSATARFPLQFSGLFEALRIAGPALPKNDVVIAVNSRGVFILDEPYKVAMGFPYFELVEAYLGRTERGRGHTLNLVTLKGDELVFLSPNSDTITKLVGTFLDGLRQRTEFAIGLEEFVLQGEGTKPFSFKKGDVIRLLDEEPTQGRNKDDWAVGICERTKAKGNFPLDCIYAVPCVERPPDEFLYMFTSLTQKDYSTLPRTRGAVVLSKQGTIGRNTKFGKETEA